MRQPDLTNVVIVTYCKGRLRQIKETFPVALQQELPDPYRLLGGLVVDFDCPDGAAAWVMTECPLARGQTLCCSAVRKDAEVWQWSRARNIGLQDAFGIMGADVCYMMDGDMLLPTRQSLAKYLERLGPSGLVSAGYTDSRYTGFTGTVGTCLVHKDAFFAVRGYDESHVGYGHDDSNFYSRVRRAGYPVDVLVGEYQHLWASDEERGRFLAAPRTDDHIQQNAAWAVDFDRPVNPLGFGRYEGFFARRNAV